MAKTKQPCQHSSTVQVGTETTVEVFCVDCGEKIKEGKTIKKKKHHPLTTNL